MVLIGPVVKSPFLARPEKCLYRLSLMRIRYVGGRLHVGSGEYLKQPLCPLYSSYQAWDYSSQTASVSRTVQPDIPLRVVGVGLAIDPPNRAPSEELPPMLCLTNRHGGTLVADVNSVGTIHVFGDVDLAERLRIAGLGDGWISRPCREYNVGYLGMPPMLHVSLGFESPESLIGG